MVRVAEGVPRNGILNIGGPDKLAFAEMAALVGAANRDGTPVIVDPSATHFGTPLDTDSLVTADSDVLPGIGLGDWLQNR